jgi:hypothetical protein
MGAADLLLGARDLIATPDRWCRRTLETTDGRLCLVGALRMVAYGTSAYRRTDRADVDQALRYVIAAACPDDTEGWQYPDPVTIAAGINDDSEHSELMGYVDDAIRAAKDTG